MKTKFRGTINSSARIDALIRDIKKQESSAKKIEIVLNGKLRLIREVNIIT